MNLKEFFYTIKIIRQTRNIQEFLWGKLNISWGLEEWKRMFIVFKKQAWWTEKKWKEDMDRGIAKCPECSH